MNHGHSKLTDWGLNHVPIGTRDTILDIGCGGGKTVYKLAATARDGKVYGIDHSETSVAVSCRTNQRWIEMGHVEIRNGSVSDPPFPDQTFDLVTAVETHYYWPDFPADLRQILRILKPGGTFITLAEAYKGGKFDKRLQRFKELMQAMSFVLMSLDEHRELLAQAGYSDVRVFEEYDKGWMCATGRKPS
jgi:ubiquinone/menaquinone biosynthesis C-methylase UbiE